VSSPTLQSVRQAIYAALTATPLSYQVDQQGTVTLATSQVVPQAVWNLAQSFAPNPPTLPAVCYAVSTTKRDWSRFLAERALLLEIWVVSNQSIDECTMLYEAVRARIFNADQDAPAGVQDLSRAGSSTVPPLALRECTEQNVYAPLWDNVANQYQLKADYRVVAV
jgi:hypothetical protein